ncbi:hypothetical protein KAR91_00965 [Candidatus Pacearchaeota archaeon]|nr:hypothetical protein [Candidatus Pacearchaeota archaeon]
MEKSPERSSSPILSQPILGLRRLMVLTALAIAPGVPSNVQAAESSAITQAAEKNDVFKVMSELIKMFGKDYKYAGKQKDGAVIQCVQEKSKEAAKSEAEKRIKAIAGKGFKIKFVEIQLGDGTWVVAAFAKKEKAAEEKNTFQVMSDLIKEFGHQYKYAGKQKDGSVIQCAQEKSKSKAEKKAKDQALKLFSGSTEISVKSHQMSDGTWIVAAQASEKKEVTRGRRGDGLGETASIGNIGSTSGGGKVDIGERKSKTVIPEQTQSTVSNVKRSSSAEMTDVFKRELTRIFNYSHTRTLKKHPNFSGKVYLNIKVRKDKVDVTLKGKQDKRALLDFEVELESRLRQLTFPKGMNEIEIPLVLNPRSN